MDGSYAIRERQPQRKRGREEKELSEVGVTGGCWIDLISSGFGCAGKSSILLE